VLIFSSKGRVRVVPCSVYLGGIMSALDWTETSSVMARGESFLVSAFCGVKNSFYSL